MLKGAAPLVGYCQASPCFLPGILRRSTIASPILFSKRTHVFQYVMTETVMCSGESTGSVR